MHLRIFGGEDRFRAARLLGRIRRPGSRTGKRGECDLSDRRSLVAGHTGRALVPASAGRLPVILLGKTVRKSRQIVCTKPAVYQPESGDSCAVLRVKWLASTCLAGVFGVAVIGVAIYASLNVEDGSGMMNSMRRAGLAALEPLRGATVADRDGSIIGQKTDRIETTALGVATRYIIHDRLVQDRGDRDFISIKPYARIVARLATAQPDNASQIPVFNPFKLHLNDAPIDEGGEGGAKPVDKDFLVRLLDLPGNVVPQDDGLELSTDDVGELVAEAEENFSMAEGPFAMKGESGEGDQARQDSVMRVAYAPDGAGEIGSVGSLAPPRNTTIIAKQPELAVDSVPAAAAPQGAASAARIMKVKNGQTLKSICIAAGVASEEAKELSDSVAKDYRGLKLKPGYTVHLSLMPSPSDPSAMDPVKVSVFDEATHKATVRRSPLGDYVVSDDPVDVELTAEQNAPQDGKASLYTSFYHAAVTQHINGALLERLLRVHSYDVDFKQRVHPGDGFELFFDTKDGPDGKDSEPNEILFTAFTVQGETRGFYRFRSPDGIVDYYDQNGDSAKRFLMRTPVKGGRFTSGFGQRKHPLLRIRRMHSGVDWAAPSGTPILAAGDGLVEAAGRNGGYGNYVRIRHANGFATSYGHLSRFAEGLVIGKRVKQGQMIGYVGTTGISTGPHLHFEVMVNNRFVDPMTINVPRGLQLQGRVLAEFQKEKQRIDNLMALSPVTSRVAAMNQ